MRREFRGFKFHVDRDGVWPMPTGVDYFNFTDPTCMDAIEEAVHFHRRVFFDGYHPNRVHDHAYVYVVKGQPITGSSTVLHKIGSTYDFCLRSKSLRGWTDLVYIIRCETREAAYSLETALHQRFIEKLKYEREWFDLTPDDIETIELLQEGDDVEYSRIVKALGLRAAAAIADASERGESIDDDLIANLLEDFDRD